jgi:glutathione S-transferase
MITLHQYPPAFGLPSLSPFCIKVEVFLKVAGLPYLVKHERNPARGPKGKMPFIVDGERTVADSSFIIEHLVEKYGLEALTVKDPAALAFQALIEESLYFILLYSRWIDADGYKVVRAAFAPLFPPLVGKPFLAHIRRNLTRQARAQGLGRHSQDEVYAQGVKQITALALQLADGRFFFEERFTTFDATAFAFLLTILNQPIASPLQECVIGHKNLCDYVIRLEELCSRS